MSTVLATAVGFTEAAGVMPTHGISEQNVL